MLEDYKASHADNRSIYRLLKPPSNALSIDDSVNDYEIAFAIDIGLDVPLVGRVDGLVEHRDTKDLWALEWKTTSELSSRFLDGFSLNPQIIGYSLALNTYNLDVKGTIIEGIRVSKTNCETLCRPIFVQDHHFSMFKKWAQFHGAMLLQMEKSDDESGESFVQNISACTPYPQFGSPGYQCHFTTLCNLPQWADAKGLYKVEEDKPFLLSERKEVHLDVLS